ncbi:ABC transporter ATP-binding protein [Salinactinospora qingdaonensis]|uniref:ABC transporter domain-containing protein n=1 Tax=Salinactinospora qingdaonensis TaxID=702744 RepID=A0ABP7FU43_9ACTN
MLFDRVVRAYGAGEVIGPVSLRVEAGECVVLAGANGVGKSTLLRLAAGVDHPTEGEIAVLGEAPRPADPEFRRAVFALEDVAYFPDLSVREHLELVAAGHGLGDRAKERVTETLHRCRLADHADASPRTLSKGQRQLLSLAVMLLPPWPRLLILDEPENHLDGAARHWLGETLHALKGENSAILLATHHAEFVDALADRVVTLTAGQGAEDTDDEEEKDESAGEGGGDEEKPEGAP